MRVINGSTRSGQLLLEEIRNINIANGSLYFLAYYRDSQLNSIFIRIPDFKLPPLEDNSTNKTGVKTKKKNGAQIKLIPSPFRNKPVVNDECTVTNSNNMKSQLLPKMFGKSQNSVVSPDDNINHTEAIERPNRRTLIRSDTTTMADNSDAMTSFGVTSERRKQSLVRVQKHYANLNLAEYDTGNKGDASNDIIKNDTLPCPAKRNIHAKKYIRLRAIDSSSVKSGNNEDSTELLSVKNIKQKAPQIVDRKSKSGIDIEGRKPIPPRRRLIARDAPLDEEELDTSDIRRQTALVRNKGALMMRQKLSPVNLTAR